MTHVVRLGSQCIASMHHFCNHSLQMLMNDEVDVSVVRSCVWPNRRRMDWSVFLQYCFYLRRRLRFAFALQSKGPTAFGPYDVMNC